jgi:Uma2 family endonuclease
MPPVAPTPERVTPEQMLRLGDDGKLYELVDGQLVEKRMSDFAQLVAGNLNDELVLWCRRTALGRSFVEATFQCFAHAPEMVRRPDVAYLSSQRLAGYAWGQRHFAVAPDLAVEVVSPRDVVYELDRKVGDYFGAGVRRVWVINPEQQTVRIHRGPGDLSEVVGETELADDALLPGFRCSLPALFARPAAAQP